MSFRHLDEASLDQFHILGIAIDYTGSHCGLLCVDEEDGQKKTVFAHMCGDGLKIDPAEKHVCTMLWSKTGLNERLARQVALLTLTIDTNLPFRLDDSALYFDMSGSLVGLEPHKGLTCATFIEVVLRSYDLALVDKDTWDIRPDDNAVQLNLVNAYVDKDDPAYEEILCTIGKPRVSPIEVAACIIQPRLKWPISFAEAVKFAHELQNQSVIGN